MANTLQVDVIADTAGTGAPNSSSGHKIRSILVNWWAYDINLATGIASTLSSSSIIEIESNTNGDYIKFLDGTMICIEKRSVVCSSVFVNMFGSTSGNTYRGTIAWTFPAAFSVAPNVMALGNGYANVIEGSAATTTSVSVFPYTLTSGNTINVDLIAIGKWK